LINLLSCLVGWHSDSWRSISLPQWASLSDKVSTLARCSIDLLGLKTLWKTSASTDSLRRRLHTAYSCRFADYHARPPIALYTLNWNYSYFNRYYHQWRFSSRLYWTHKYWCLPFVPRFEFVMNCMVRYSLLSSMNHGFAARSSSLQFHFWAHLCYAHASDSVELSCHGSSCSSWQITAAQSPVTIHWRCSKSSLQTAAS